MAKKYHSRKFLNKDGGMAAIEIHSDLTSWSLDAHVSISDCNRQVQLDFSVYTAKDIKAKRDKLDLVINELIKLKEYMSTNHDSIVELIDKRNKKGMMKSIEDAINE